LSVSVVVPLLSGSLAAEAKGANASIATNAATVATTDSIVPLPLSGWVTSFISILRFAAVPCCP
jgi:hypothetical protein